MKLFAYQSNILNKYLKKKLSPTDQVWQCSRGYAILARLRGFTISARRRGFAIRAQQSLKSSNPNPQIGRYLIH